MAQQFDTIDDYIAAVPPDARPVVEAVRAAVHRALPGAEETISYQMPTFTLDGRRIVHLGAWKHHISLYPAPDVDEAFERQLAPYRSDKATLKFPLRKPMPYDLIEQVVVVLAARGAGGDR